MYGFHGRLLHIDLNSGKSSWRELEESRLRASSAASASAQACSTNMPRRESILFRRLTR